MSALRNVAEMRRWRGS